MHQSTVGRSAVTMFRTLVLIVALTGLAAASYQDEPIFKSGNSMFLKSADPTQGPTTTAAPVTTCPNKLYSCADCNTARLCVPNGSNSWRWINDIKCTGATPYCEKATGSCVADPDIDCGAKDNFICTQDGYMPDNNDCTKYHVCKNYVDNAFQCLNKVYDAGLKACVESQAVCAGFDCSNNNGRKVPHKTYDTYFAYCYGNDVSVVDKCQGNYVLNATSQECEPPCKANGAVASNEDCTKYYTCTMVYYKKDVVIPELTPQQCPPKMAFDPVHLVCTDNVASIPNCHV